ncbi:hypothetical protein LIER_24336 [Lithospermum erythrorhizon]|uniref:Uncharacterized protein n=1 Tax=Lithospermum erythrorhizon TaxID=34254 RepID=A0AAV3R0W7_LITER
MAIQPMGRQMKDWSLLGVVDHPSCIVVDDATKNAIEPSFMGLQKKILTPTDQTMVDNSVGGAFGGKTVPKFQEIF